MSTVTELDIKELKNLIVGFRQETNERLTALNEQIQKIETDLVETKTKLTTLEPAIQKIPDLAEKVGELKN